jgi:ATP-dependent Clp protease ATP-binding subunit ClpA
VFEHFTDRARQVVILAQEESRILHHDYIGTEHLLLGMLRIPEDPVAALLLLHGVTVETTRARVVEIVGQGTAPRTGQLPFTPRAVHVLELSLREMTKRGDEIIAPWHIALGLTRETEGVAARILLDHGLDFDTLDRGIAGDGLDEFPHGLTIRDLRRARVQARLTVWSRRAELVELVSRAKNANDAVQFVAERFGLSTELASEILRMQIWSFTADEVERLKQEFRDLMD